MTQSEHAAETEVVYDIEDKPPIGESLALGFQHVLSMILGNVAVPLILATTLGLSEGDTTFLVQIALIIAGAATLVQVYPIGPIGGKVPIMMGTSFAFLGTLTVIGNQYGLPAILGAALAGSVVQLTIGATYERFEVLFPPLVNGVVVMLIGLTLIPTGIDYAAGASGGPASVSNYASMTALTISGTVFLVTLVLNQFFRGILRIASVFFGILIGYVMALSFGIVDFGPVANAGWIAVPVPLQFGLEFHPDAILAIAAVYLIVSMETVGNISATIATTGRSAETSELRGGVFADGAMSAIASLFGAFPNTSFAQNVGLISFTGVASRHVVGIAGSILLIAGFVPKVSALVTTMPAPVLGGGATILFAMIFTSGLQIIDREVPLTNRSLTILAVSMALGLGVTFRPELLANFPQMVRTFFGSGVVTGGLAVLILNLLIPNDDPPVTETPTQEGTAATDDD